VGQVAKPSVTDKVRYGQYLADIGHCMDCHTPRGKDGMLVQSAMGAGGQVFKGPFGSSVSRNLTSHESGLKGWSDAQVEKAIRTGVDRNGQPYKPPMAFSHYARINQADMAALIAYLRTLPPLPMGGAR
jgi:mono/diheme cytochrome c family protein